MAGYLRPLHLPEETEALVTLLREVHTDASAWRRQRLDDELVLLSRLRLAYRLARRVPTLLPLPVGWGWEDRRGRLAGAVLVRSLRPGGAVQLIDHLAVQPADRKQGIGRCLLETALSSLRQQGALVATLEVDPDNVAAGRLYAAAGFRVVDEAVDLVHPASVRQSLSSGSPAGHEFEVRAYRRGDLAPLQRLSSVAIPWIPDTAASGPRSVSRLRAARTAAMRWLVDRVRAQERRSYVVTGSGGGLLAFAEIVRASQTPAALLGLTPPYHRLRLIGIPDLPPTAADALLAAVLTESGPGPRHPRPILTTVSERQPALVKALQQAGFIAQEQRHRLALNLAARQRETVLRPGSCRPATPAVAPGRLRVPT
ncbi:MAG: hypothetical protein CL878_14675 [Dehalococcoidia bacterium]|nr:hypothetical protein [Dehalococcoidia bacterium]